LLGVRYRPSGYGQVARTIFRRLRARIASLPVLGRSSK
jgi:hypothetical protein